jgi:hypothetical protein
MAAARNPLPPENQDASMTEEEWRQRQIEKNQSVIALLDSWINVSEEEAQEQKETLEFLMKALDEDRPSYRKLFP